MNLSATIYRVLFVLLVCSATFCRAGIRIIPQANNENNVYLHPMTIQFGLGSPAVGKVAYVYVSPPGGGESKLAEAENVSDFSQSISYTPTQVGTYTFYYKYSFTSQGIPITTVTSQQLTTVQNGCFLSNSTSATYSPPYQTVTLSAFIVNTGTSTWIDNVYWVHVTDYSGATVGYVNAGNVPPQTGRVYQFNVTIPNIGGTGTATYHFRMLQGGVEWFGNTLDIPVIIDYKPTTSLGASRAYLPSGQTSSATNVSSTTSATYANVINQAIDYLAPGSGVWVSGTAGKGTRWDGSATNSNTLSYVQTMSPSGTWQFRARGQDNMGQLSDFQSVTVSSLVIDSFTGSIPEPSVWITSTDPVNSGVSINWGATNASAISLKRDDSNLGVGVMPYLDSGLATGSHTYTVVATPSNTVNLAWRAIGASSYKITGAGYDSGWIGGSSISVPTPGTYTLTATDGQNFATTNCTVQGLANILKSVTIVIPPGVVIKQQPMNTTVAPGANASFSVVADNAAYYQWRKGGANIPGLDPKSSTLVLTAVTASIAGAYDVVVTNGAGSVTSATATLSLGGAPIISQQPTSKRAPIDSTVMLSVGASSATSYKWRKGGVDIPGATSASYSIEKLSASNIGYYDVIVSNQYGTTTSDSVSVNILSAPTISLQPPSVMSVSLGSLASIGVTAVDAESYQWMKDGVPISGRTLALLSISSVAISDAGSYAVVVSNAAGSVTSAGCQLTITARDSDADGVPDDIESKLGTNPNASNSVDTGGATQLRVHQPNDK